MRVKTYEKTANSGLNDLLRPEDARRLRAQAWRHVRRINTRVARETHQKMKAREQALPAAPE